MPRNIVFELTEHGGTDWEFWRRPLRRRRHRQSSSSSSSSPVAAIDRSRASASVPLGGAPVSSGRRRRRSASLPSAPGGRRGTKRRWRRGVGSIDTQRAIVPLVEPARTRRVRRAATLKADLLAGRAAFFRIAKCPVRRSRRRRRHRRFRRRRRRRRRPLSGTTARR